MIKLTMLKKIERISNQIRKEITLQEKISLL